MHKLRLLTILGGITLSSLNSFALDSTANADPRGNITINQKTTPTTTFVEISPAAYYHNLQEIRKMLGPNVKICAVMKSNAYGHGIDNLIAEALKANVDYIAAVDNNEFRLLANRIKAAHKKTHLLRIAPVTKAELIEAQTANWNVEEIAGSLEEAKMLSDTATELSKKLGRKVIISIHVNVETGMGRMGFRDVNEIKQAIALPNLKLVGIMTHFAKDYEDPPIDYNATRAQLDVFESVVKELNLNKNVIQHVANSGAAAKFPWARKDMVRVGSLTYGEDLDDRQDPKHVLQPVMSSFKTTVAIIERNVPPHSPINYDAMQYTRSDKPSTTATIRIGYYNGFPQYAFQESAVVLIRGQKFPVIGKTSMNMLVIDVTDEDPQNPVKLGDEVVLVGKQGKQRITWDEFAARNKMGITEQVLLIGNQSPHVIIKDK